MSFNRRLFLIYTNEYYPAIKKEKAQINKIRNEKGEITTNTTEIQRIVREPYEKLYANKVENLEEMVKFLEMYHLPKLKQENIENMISPITSNEIELHRSAWVDHNKRARFGWIESHSKEVFSKL